MPRSRVDEILRLLHEELSQAPELGAEARESLEEIGRDIRALTGTPPDGFMDHLREATAQFEESHPRIAAVIGRLSDTLSSLGI